MKDKSNEQDLTQRIRRLYAALGVTEEHDMASLPGKVHASGRGIFVLQDFSGGKTKAEIELKAASLISNIAHLDDHLQKWAEAKGMDKKNVSSHWQNSFEWRVIRDLNNAEKHGYPLHNDGRTKKSPRLQNVRRILRITTSPIKGGMVALTLGSGATPRIQGGSGVGVITGEIVDKDDHPIGELDDIARKAVQAYEMAFQTLGISIPS